MVVASSTTVTAATVTAAAAAAGACALWYYYYSSCYSSDVNEALKKKLKKWGLGLSLGALVDELGCSALAALGVRPSAEVIDGKAVAASLRAEVAGRIKEVNAGSSSTGSNGSSTFVPGLAVVIVGERRDSQTYVRMKKRACEEVGIRSFSSELDASVSQDDVLQLVRRLNADRSVHGILVQLPLPAHIDEAAVLAAISIEKDVDGFHPLNIGRLATKGRDPLFVPCTPRGCVELLRRTGTEISGARVCVLGRSNIVGMPVAALLQEADATVTVVHSRTPRDTMVDAMRSADIVIAAAGKPEMVRGDWIKPGATVIDVGINPVEDASKKRGYRLVGDVCFDEAIHVAGKITPVPGGVGPMTIAMLMLATLESAERRIAQASSRL